MIGTRSAGRGGASLRGPLVGCAAGFGSALGGGRPQPERPSGSEVRHEWPGLVEKRGNVRGAPATRVRIGQRSGSRQGSRSEPSGALRFCVRSSPGFPRWLQRESGAALRGGEGVDGGRAGQAVGSSPGQGEEAQSVVIHHTTAATPDLA
jgi:hypothetical protein